MKNKIMGPSFFLSRTCAIISQTREAKLPARPIPPKIFSMSYLLSKQPPSAGDLSG